VEILSHDSGLNPYGTNLYIQNEFMGVKDEFPELKQRRAFVESVA